LPIETVGMSKKNKNKKNKKKTETKKTKKKQKNKKKKKKIRKIKEIIQAHVREQTLSYLQIKLFKWPIVSFVYHHVTT
jgi:L-fucose isomerase-like protein